MRKSPPLRKRRRNPPLLRPAALLGLLLSAGSASNQFGHWHPGFDLLGQFKPQWCLALLFPLLLMLLMRQRGWVLFFLGVLSLNLLEILPWYFPVSKSPSPQGTTAPREVKILLANVLNTNPEVSALARLITRETPDLVALMEFHPKHLALMNGLGRAYPYRYRPVDQNYFGLGLWSKYPLYGASLRFLSNAELPVLGTWVEANHRAFYLLLSHLDSPVRVPALKRNRQLESLAQYAQGKEPPLIMLGDFNIAMWSPYFKQLETHSGLQSCRRGFGILPSWPVYLPTLARIPIDHCLAGPELDIRALRLGPPLGSDHLPLLVTLALPSRFEE